MRHSGGTSRPEHHSPRVRARRRADLIGGVRVSALEAGPRAATTRDVVLVHGLAISNRCWRRVIARLGADHRVLAPDLPGVGRSSEPDRELGLADLVAGLVVWMDAVGVRQPILVGHSLGSEVVAVLAAEHPQRVSGVVLVSPGGGTIRRPLWQQALRLAADGLRERPSMLVIAVTDYLRVGTRSMLHAIREARRWDGSQVVPRIEAPALVVHGGRDLLVTDRWSRQVAEWLPKGSLVRMPRAPHGLPWSGADELAATVRDFARSDPPQPSD